MTRVTVDLGERSYDIVVGDGAITQSSRPCSRAGASR